MCSIACGRPRVDAACESEQVLDDRSAGICVSVEFADCANRFAVLSEKTENSVNFLGRVLAACSRHLCEIWAQPGRRSEIMNTMYTLCRRPRSIAALAVALLGTLGVTAVQAGVVRTSGLRFQGHSGAYSQPGNFGGWTDGAGWIGT